MSKLPTVGERDQLGFVDLNIRTAFCEFTNDIVEKLSGRCVEIDGYAEARGKRKLFLHGIGAMKITLVFHVVSVVPGFLDQVASVGGCVDQNIIGSGFHTTLNDCLEEFVFQLIVFKGKIVDEDNESVIAVLYGCDDLREVAELVLVDLDHAESRIVIFVDEGLDRGGFARSGIAVEKHVVCGDTAEKCLCVFRERFFLKLIAHHIGKHDFIRVVDGEKFDTVSVVANAECTVQTEHTDTVQAVEFRNEIKKFMLIFGFGKLFAESLDLFADTSIIILFRFRNGSVICERREAINAECGFDFGKVKVKKLTEYTEIIFSEMIHASFSHDLSFGGQGEGIFICDQKKREIILPKIPIESVCGRKVKNTLNLRINATDE